ncbi:hypothetical protein JW805_01400 [Roseomonas aeriglobus]|nr:hypothetical protein [Roseomonas aeriglobus]
MARFLFHLHECDMVTLDEEGREFPDLCAALNAAREEARGLLAAEAAAGFLCLGCRIEIVEQSTGHSVNLPFTAAIELTQGVSDKS